MLALCSCVAEDLSDCPPPGAPLVVKTDHEAGRYLDTRADSRISRSSDIMEWYDCIENVTVYIFDGQDRFVTFWEGGAHNHGVDFEVPLGELGLADGLYTFVVWTNRGLGCYVCNVYERSVGDHFDEFNIRAVIPEDGHMENDFAHRHHGILENVRVSAGLVVDTDRNAIVIDPTVHRVNFSFSGLRPSGGGYSLTVSDSNPAHDFRNEPIGDQSEYHHIHSLTPLAAEGGTRAGEPVNFATSMLLQQLQDDTTTTMTLTDAGGEFEYSVDLVETIETVAWLVAGQQVDFDHTLEFDVAIDFSGNAAIGITVNGWYYRLNEYEL